MLDDLLDDPLAQLREDRRRAGELRDPHAGFATLATVEGDQPTVRVVTVRAQEPDRLLLSANATSPKVQALRDNPRCELLCYWVTLQRQYRLRGQAIFVPAEQRPALYAQVPLRAKTWDQVYETLAQSTPVTTRADYVEPFIARLTELQQRHAHERDVPATPSAGYIALVPDLIEIQQLDLAERLHDRRRFARTRDGHWRQTLLVP